jgi:hypothetical protein
MYRMPVAAGVAGFLALVLAGCHSGSAASPAASATVVPVSTATPSSGFSVPGTHRLTTVYRVSGAISSVVVISHVGDVTVIGGASGSATSVSQEAEYSSTPPVTSRVISGGTLTVTYTCPTQLVCGVAYVVRVPRDVMVQASADAGTIRLTGLGGQVTANAKVGSISATGLTGSIVSLTTDVGGISATFAGTPATIQAVTRVGAITLRVPGSASYKVSVTDHLGKATVSIPQSASSPHAITVTADVGTVLIGPLA